MSKQLVDRELLGGVVFHDKQPLSASGSVLLHTSEGRTKGVRRSGLGQKCEGAVSKPMLAVLVEGQHLNGNVPGSIVLFQMVEHGPTQHVGQKYI
jgi:hypothetical protein